MGIVDQRIVVILRRTLPGQRHTVCVAGIAEVHRVISVHGGCIGNADSAVRIAGVDHRRAGIHGIGRVDFGQAAVGHLDGHYRFLCGCGGIGNPELAVCFAPGGDQIRAGCVLIKRDNHIIFVVAQAGRQRIDEGTPEWPSNVSDRNQICRK